MTESLPANFCIGDSVGHLWVQKNGMVQQKAAKADANNIPMHANNK